MTTMSLLFLYTARIAAYRIFSFFPQTANALLRGEQRNTEAAAYHLNHLSQRKVKMPRVANPS